MNYAQARQYIKDTMKYGSKLGLENIKELLKRLDNPQNKLKIIHIAGTNGKGSTLAFISSILKAAGYKVGRYISPTVFSYRERIQINENYIEEAAFAAGCTKLKDIIEGLVIDGYDHPTSFEIETALAFDYFLNENCDIVVLETGLGGLEDATNVMDQVLVSVITSISMDHMTFLGNSIEEITENKAGIIKSNCPVVLYEQDASVMEIIFNKARELNAEITITKNKAVDYIDNNIEIDFVQKINYISVSGVHYNNIALKLLGFFQGNNAATAIEVIEAIGKQGYIIPKELIIKGLENTVWNGRFQCINKNPLMFIDGAHNPGAAIRFKETIEKYFTNHQIIYIMGVLADKDFTKVIDLTAPLASKIYTITPKQERALDGKVLAKSIININRNVTYCESINEAVKSAFADSKAAPAKSVIIAFGSLSYLRDILGSVEYFIKD